MKGRCFCVLLLGICRFGLATVNFHTPAAGAQWELASSRSISWLSTVPLAGGVLELYQGGARIGRLNVTVPLGEGEQATTWVVGNMAPSVPVAAGTYTIRLNRMEEGPLIAECAAFRITQSVTFLAPAAGSSWAVGTTQTIQWRFNGYLGEAYFKLYRFGAFVATMQAGAIALGPGEYGNSWVVGNMTPAALLIPGPGYTIRLDRHPGADPTPVGESPAFSISGGFELRLPSRLVVSLRNPPPPDCPNCGFFDLGELQKLMASLPERVKVALEVQGKHLASLGFSGKGDPLPARAKIELPAELLAALRKGAVKGELKLRRQDGRLLLSHPLLITPSK